MTEVSARDAFSVLLRLDFGFFLQKAFAELGGESAYSHNWHIEAIIWQLERIRQRENRRLIVTIPPRHLKSRTVSIAWVAWMLGRNPALSFLCVSYGQTLAEDHARDCLKLIDSAWYREAFPQLTLTRRAVEDFRTSAGGGRLSTSIDGVTTGFGADIIIIDDPMKAQDTLSQAARDKVATWFDETLMQRLNDQATGSIILVMQRLHEADLVGTLKQRDGWHELCLPAIATCDEAIAIGTDRAWRRREGCALHPARQPLAMLLERKAANPHVFAGQFQQDPIPALGNIVEAGWLQYFAPGSIDTSTGQIVMSLDTASKDNPFNDWSVFVVARVLGKAIHILDVARARLQFPQLKARAIEFARVHGAQVLLIEDAASGQQLIQTLRAEYPRGVPPPLARRPEGDKISRLMGVSAMIQAGRLFLPERAHWLGDYTGELLGFPASRHDDQVDATAQLLSWVQEKDMYRLPLNAGPIAMDEFDLSVDGLESHKSSDYEDDPWGAY